MKRLRIYLDTSVINYLFHEDVPDLRKITEEFFETYVKPRVYEVYVSEVVIREIEQTPDSITRGRLLTIPEKYGLTSLSLSEEAFRLATLYIEAGIIPAKKLADARHVAIATCNELDLLLSWNFKHIANIRKQTAVQAINQREGFFHPLILSNPMEAFHEHD